MKNIIIKPLSKELNNDYLDFFDNRAFTDNNPNGPCYCTSPNQDEKSLNEMVSEFKTYGVKNTLRKYAVRMLNAESIHGYLAFDGKVSVAWCNANNMDSYQGFIPEMARENKAGKTMSIVCFEISPEYRKKGIALKFIDVICEYAKENGFVAVEGYPKLTNRDSKYPYQGSQRLFEKAGFELVLENGATCIMRKFLNSPRVLNKLCKPPTGNKM